MVFSHVGTEFWLHGVHIEVGIRGEDVDGLEVVFLPESVVVHIMRGRYFQAARTETDFHITVFNNRDDAPYTRYDDVLAAQPLVLLLLWVDANGNIAEDSLGAGGSHYGIVGTCLGVHHTRFRHFVAQVVEFAVLVVVDHLLVAEGGLALGVPVHHTQSAVDKSFLIQVAEYVDNGFGAGLVHRERGAVPVAGATEFAELLQDDSSVFVRPVPCVFEELLAREVGLVDTLLFETLDDLGFGGNRSMVGTRHPAGVLALKACAAHEDVLYRLVQHVPHVEYARYVRRRDNHRKRLSAVGFAVKKFVVKPILIPACFDVCRIVFRFHLSGF